MEWEAPGLLGRVWCLGHDSPEELWGRGWVTSLWCKSLTHNFPASGAPSQWVFGVLGVACVGIETAGLFPHKVMRCVSLVRFVLVLLVWWTLLEFLLEQELWAVKILHPGKSLFPIDTSLVVKPLGQVFCCQHMVCAPL